MLVSQEHPFYKLNNKRRLASILKTDVKNFNEIENVYKVYPFKKLIGKKERDLFNTDINFKSLLRRLNVLLCQLNIPDFVYAGIPNRDFLDNALAHQKKAYLQSADIKDFFPTTSDSYVYGFFQNKLQTSPDVAKILTLLTTHHNINSNSRHIPQGFPTSTILSFLSYFDLFNGINNVCKQNDIHFTLFVDDMTFSSHKRIPKSFLTHVNSIVKKYNLEIHPDKMIRTNPNKHKKITGIIVEPTNKSLKAPNQLQKKMFDNFKIIHDYSISSYADYIQFKRLVLTLEGQLRSIKRIEPNRQTPYIDKVLKDIKNNFNHSTVKGASHEILMSEFKNLRQ